MKLDCRACRTFEMVYVGVSLYFVPFAQLSKQALEDPIDICTDYSFIESNREWSGMKVWKPLRRIPPRHGAPERPGVTLIEAGWA